MTSLTSVQQTPTTASRQDLTLALAVVVLQGFELYVTIRICVQKQQKHERSEG